MTMFLLIIFFGMLVMLAIASLRWGVNSRDRIDSAEWRRRSNYPQHHL